MDNRPGFKYLSDEDKSKILKSHEQNQEQSASTTSQPKPTQPSPSIDIHIIIHTYGRNREFHLEGDVYNQDDLAKIHERFKDHMPRKKLFGII